MTPKDCIAEAGCIACARGGERRAGDGGERGGSEREPRPITSRAWCSGEKHKRLAASHVDGRKASPTAATCRPKLAHRRVDEELWRPPGSRRTTPTRCRGSAGQRARFAEQGPREATPQEMRRVLAWRARLAQRDAHRMR